jgi:oligosaccharide repeat unit polymerase
VCESLCGGGVKFRSVVQPLFDPSISVAALLDTFVVICGAILLYRYARLTAVHPGFVYLVYHVMFVTFRLYSVWAGSPTLFSHWRGAIRVTEAEIAWAGVLADLAFLSMTAAFVLCSRRDQRRNANRSVAEWSSRLLSERVILAVSSITFPIGVVAILVFTNLPTGGNLNFDIGQWSTSSWVVVTQFWPILVLLGLIYYYGFRRAFVIPTLLLLALMSIQGYDRFRVILPVIFFLITWLTRTGHRWPKKWILISLLCMGLISFPMKKMGVMIRAGAPLSDVVDFGKQSLGDVFRGSSDDQKFLDMFASVMWLVDESGHHFYGAVYYPLLTMPIPRQIWPDKPPLNWYWSEINNPARPMRDSGMIATLPGESYANFGLPGVVLVPFFAAYCLGVMYFSAMRKSYFSVYRFIYVILACSLVQIYRDGLISAIVFPLVNMMPLTAIAVLSLMWKSRRATVLKRSTAVPA